MQRRYAQTRLNVYLFHNADNPYSLEACHNPIVVAQPVETDRRFGSRKCAACGDWLAR